ncbi:MAG: hypothetical protein LH606_13910 [Cytophagaceae bacterium]|nr:hypothetical protein [Cytophagaceae bacterium]
MGIDYNFSLERQAIVLQEVMVRAESLPIKVRGDTTTYNVQKFADGSEKVIKDLLRKLPGIQVSENGGISFKGKPIDKILLEGEEFFAKNYRLLSKNLSSNLLDKVEAIENTSDSPLLKGLDRSDKTILNLQLKPDHKRTLFGNADVAAGPPKLLDVRANAFSLIDRLKFGVIGAASNTGHNPVSGIEYDLGADQSDATQPTQSEMASRPLIQAPSISTPSLPLERTNFNRIGLGAINANVAFSPKVKLRAFNYGFSDRNTQTIARRNEYLLENTSLIVADTQRLRSDPRVATGQVELEFLPTPGTQWKWRSFLYSKTTPSLFSVVSQNPQRTEYLDQTTQETSIHWQHQLSYIHRIAANRAFTVDASYRLIKRPQHLLVASDRFVLLFPAVTQGVATNIGNENRGLGVQARWLQKFAHGQKTSLTLRHDDQLETFRSGIEGQPKNDQWQWLADSAFADSAFVNNALYHRRQVSAEGEYTVPLGNLDLSLSLAGRQVGISYTEATRGEQVKDIVTYVNPFMGLRWRVSEVSKLQVVYARNQMQSALTDLLGGNVLTNYRSFQRGTTRLNRPVDEVILANYSFVDWMQQFTLISNLTFSRTKSPFIDLLSVDDLFTRTQTGISSNPNDNLSAFTQVDKYLSSLQVNVRGILPAEWTTYQSQVNESPIQLNLVRTWQGTINGRTAFDGIFNAELGGEWVVSQLRDAQESIRQTRIIKPVVALKAKPSKAWYALLVYESVYWQNDIGQQSFHFLDGIVRYTPRKPNLTVELTAKNLLNGSSATFTQLTNYLVSQTTYQLLPRQVMIRLDFRF